MVDKKISELTSLTGAGSASGDLFVAVDVSDNVTKSITRDQTKVALGISTADSPSFTGLTVSGGVANFGVSDTTRGIVQIHGAGTGNTSGGELRIFAAADHDTTVNYWRIFMDSDQLKINATGVGDGLRFNADQEAVFPRIATFNNGLTSDGPIVCQSYTVATVPSAASAGAGSLIYVTNETGGATHAASDGTNWRRMSDRAIIS